MSAGERIGRSAENIAQALLSCHFLTPEQRTAFADRASGGSFANLQSALDVVQAVGVEKGYNNLSPSQRSQIAHVIWDSAD